MTIRWPTIADLIAEGRVIRANSGKYHILQEGSKFHYLCGTGKGGVVGTIINASCRQPYPEQVCKRCAFSARVDFAFSPRPLIINNAFTGERIL